MSDVDLTEPLDAAARAHWASYPQSKFVTYDEIPANVKNTLKTSLLKPVQAAVELAVAAERGRIKAHLEATLEEMQTWCGPYGYQGVGAFIDRRDAHLRTTLEEGLR